MTTATAQPRPLVIESSINEQFVSLLDYVLALEVEARRRERQWAFDPRALRES